MLQGSKQGVAEHARQHEWLTVTRWHEQYVGTPARTRAVQLDPSQPSVRKAVKGDIAQHTVSTRACPHPAVTSRKQRDTPQLNWN
jgi:hypothetical protein